ncbi:MAG: ferredoxin--NADP reductase [Bacteroidetes bacterium]|nr:ferredoxin--NADP reductase [Bacteroidota bacterium]
MVYKYSPSTIYKIVHESDLVRRFFFKVPDEIPFNFKAGQFVMLHLPIDSKYKNRSYSIASAPNEENTFELAIILNPRGLGTPYLWENVAVGTQIDVSKPLGKFSLSLPIEEDICFVCTGTGIAPLRSMLVDILNKNIPCKNLYMIFGNRFEKDIIYRSEMEDLQKKHPNFKFIPVLSRENPGWEGKKGYVHQVYEELFADRRPATFYLCGWRDMLHETRQRLEAMGYDKKHIKFESYD